MLLADLHNYVQDNFDPGKLDQTINSYAKKMIFSLLLKEKINDLDWLWCCKNDVVLFKLHVVLQELTAK